MKRNLASVLASIVMVAAAAGAPARAQVPLEVGHDGPFPGAVTQDARDRHVFDNYGVLPRACYQAHWVFRVGLSYEPPMDVLTLRVGGEEVTGVDGHAELSVESNNSCARFAIEVAGATVERATVYVVEVDG